MMTPTPVRIPLSDAVTLYAIQTDRFKTARLSIYTMMPADEVQSPLGTLLFGILRRGTQKYPRLSLLNRRLDELYGTTLTLRNFLRGDDHVLSFTAEMLSDAYTFSGDNGNILEGTMEVMAEMLLHPLRDMQGLLRRDTVEAEVISMIDGIRAEVNDPRTYAAAAGDIEQLAAVVPDSEKRFCQSRRIGAPVKAHRHLDLAFDAAGEVLFGQIKRTGTDDLIGSVHDCRHRDPHAGGNMSRGGIAQALHQLADGGNYAVDIVFISQGIPGDYSAAQIADDPFDTAVTAQVDTDRAAGIGQEFQQNGRLAAGGVTGTEFPDHPLGNKFIDDGGNCWPGQNALTRQLRPGDDTGLTEFHENPPFA